MYNGTFVIFGEASINEKDVRLQIVIYCTAKTESRLKYGQHV